MFMLHVIKILQFYFSNFYCLVLKNTANLNLTQDLAQVLQQDTLIFTDFNFRRQGCEYSTATYPSDF